MRLVFQLRKELETSQGTLIWVADHLGHGSESVRRWVAQAEIDGGDAVCMSTADRQKMKNLEQENRDLRRARATA